MTKFFVMVFALGLLASPAGAEPEVVPLGMPGSVFERIVAQCRAQQHCSATFLIPLQPHDLCGLTPGVLAWEAGAVEELLDSCLPWMLFRGRPVELRSYTRKREVLEKIGQPMPEGLETIYFMYRISDCASGAANGSGIISVKAQEGVILFNGDVSPTCPES